MADKPTVPLAHSSAIIHYTSDIVAAYVSNTSLTIPEVIAVIRSVHDALSSISEDVPRNSASTLKPAVPIKKSVTPDYIVCLEDGKKLKMLKRYLRTHFRLSPEEYRAKWHLPPNYPMVAPKYAEARSRTAKEHGLGQRLPRAAKKRKRGV
jgi:predicted transcriptional regulator